MLATGRGAPPRDARPPREMADPSDLADPGLLPWLPVVDRMAPPPVGNRKPAASSWSAMPQPGFSDSRTRSSCSTALLVSRASDSSIASSSLGRWSGPPPARLRRSRRSFSILPDDLSSFSRWSISCWEGEKEGAARSGEGRTRHTQQYATPAPCGGCRPARCPHLELCLLLPHAELADLVVEALFLLVQIAHGGVGLVDIVAHGLLRVPARA